MGTFLHAKLVACRAEWWTRSSAQHSDVHITVHSRNCTVLSTSTRRNSRSKPHFGI